MAMLTALLLASAALHARAQSARADPPFSATTLDIAASGEVRTAPDMATIGIGVDTTAPSAGQAMSANAARIARIIATLESAGIAGRDVQTSGLGLSPQTLQEDGRPPKVTGYLASEQLTVTIRALGKLGAVVDSAVAGGATDIGQISFGLSDPLAAENAARLAAVKALQDKAALYAQASGYHAARLINLREGAAEDSAPRPFRPMAAAMRVVSSSPIEAGDVTVHIDVGGVFELAR
jgi:uncharacterized protein YggE